MGVAVFRKKAVWVAALATGTIAATLPSTAASASVTFMSASYYVTNLASTSVPPGPNNTQVMTADIPMRQGESLRVTDQLSLTLTASNSPEMNNQLTCTEPGGQVFQTSDGTNLDRGERRD